MYRYFALITNNADAGSLEFCQQVVLRLQSAPEHWTSVYGQHGLLAFHFGPYPGRYQAYGLHGHGVLMGRLFHRDPEGECEGRDVVFSQEQARHIRQTGGRHLVEHYWGRYVAFVRRPAGRWRVIRDPTASIPCYFSRQNGVVLVFSHLEDWRRACEPQASVNWRHVGAYLQFSRLVCDDTGLNEVSRIQGGECVELGGGREPARSFHWSPLRFVQAEPLEDPVRAADTLRRVVRANVRSWAACYQNVLHQLSGGLDSSIVLACLARGALTAAERRIVCMNLFTETAEGDERVLARKVARRFGCELVEAPLRATPRLLRDLLQVTGSSTPSEVSFRTASEDARKQLVEESGVEAIFSGQGGDHLFHRRRGALIAGEYWQRRRSVVGLGHVVLQTARMARVPATSVLGTAMRVGLLAQRHDPYEYVKAASFFALDRASATRGLIVHPWVQEARYAPAAKVQQIADVVDCQCFYAALCRYADIVHPLISQPIIECCLRIPTYTLTRGGTERALVRAAFSNDLPPEVIARTEKGDASGFYHALIMRSLGAIRELLLDGLLVREGVLERARLEGALRESSLLAGMELSAVLNSVIAETWVRGAIGV